MPMIAPNFGLDREYDEFLACMASGLVAAVAGIFGNHLEARVYLANLIQTLLRGMGGANDRIVLYNAVWLLHMSAGLSDPAIFDFARDLINSRGGAGAGYLITPEFYIPSNADYNPQDFRRGRELLENRAQVPEICEFRRRQRAVHPASSETDHAILLGVQLLTQQGNLNPLALPALRLLSESLSSAGSFRNNK